jgi:hypothetical protein
MNKESVIPADQSRSGASNTHLLPASLGLAPFPPVPAIILDNFALFDQLPELPFGQKLAPFILAPFTPFSFFSHARPPC